MIDHDLLSLWGKARPEPSSGQRWHPLLAHMVDVAAVAELLAKREDWPLPVPMIAFLAAVHDLGKLAPAFQAKVPEHWPKALYDQMPSVNTDVGHDALGLWLLMEMASSDPLAMLFPGWNSSQRQTLFVAFVGHHGSPPEEQRVNPKSLSKKAQSAAARVVTVLAKLFAPTALARPDDASLSVLAYRLAGLAIEADWIGSSQHFFPYRHPSEVADLERYLVDIARPAAACAVAAAGRTGGHVQPFGGLTHLFPRFIAVPATAQDWAQTVALPAAPVLAIIEDATGSGKTEAALTLAHRLIAQGTAKGLYVALPTMATANAMYRRLAEVWGRLYQPDAKASLILAHGRADLDQDFTASIYNAAAQEESLAQGTAPADETASAQCAAWLADDRRRALLADVGVGTIDQALFAVLAVRHAALRLRGLSGKVLIIDEAHAFDAFMEAELLALLRFHAAVGGSVIILSATLSLALRQRLIAAFGEGRGQRPSAPVSATAYPLATLVGSTGTSTEHKLVLRPGLQRSVPVRAIATQDEAVGYLSAAAAKGAAAVWIRNTVDEALAAAEALRLAGLQPILFHARFAMADRLRIEQAVLQQFNKDSAGDTRRAVLVATQVVEQSLDLDFDVMVSDLAPVDLLIQRAGRLWRHADRTGRPVDQPEFLVLAPAPTADADAAWLADYPGTGAVYSDHALLWRGWRALLEAGRIDVPGGLRHLIETAADVCGTPKGLIDADLAATGKRSAHAALASQKILTLREAYLPSAGAWLDDTVASTRLTEREEVTLRLARIEQGRVVPYAEDADLRRAWALSEVRLARSWIKQTTLPLELVAPCRAARSQWGRWERDATDKIWLVLLEATAAVSWFTLLGVESTKAGTAWVYDPGQGLQRM